LPSETMIWQPEFTDKTLSRKPGAVQPQTLEEVIAHYKGDSRVVDANHDVFDYVMLRKEFTEDKQGNPTPEGQG
ncbi:hypothetical protein, partial [Escherichia coli]|uniref:hypothetical protein n=1 Tax=Escherichia coli TaxID=562 RepID=UPI002DD42A00